jgi:acetyl esterase/lipase
MSEEVIKVWSHVPLAQGDGPEDTPDITVYRPEKPSGAAFIICPGGGWVQKVAHEKEPVARWLAQRGITAFLLSYRVGPRYHHPAPWLDAAESIRLVRARSRELGVDPQRIGIMGFSAGGHLAAHTAVAFDTPELNKVSGFRGVSSRPDLMVLVYPVIGFGGPYERLETFARLLGDHPTRAQVDSVTLDKHASAKTPPAFIVHSTLDTRVPCEHSLVFAMVLRKYGVPLEMHLYERGEHGFGSSPMAPKDPVLATWLTHLEAWLANRGFMPAG